MTDSSFENLYDNAVEILGALSPSLTYHNLSHTLDVLKQSVVIAKELGIHDEQSLKILKAAALFHDTGFLRVYHYHEEESCKIAGDILPAHGYTSEEIEDIKVVIMATKIPHQPKNILSEILCDADLDYLGRDDFFIIGQQLKAEWFRHEMIKTDEEWHEKQLKFLNFHHYFTSYSIAVRKPLKDTHLASLSAV